MSTAIANQMFLAFLGRPADAAWLSSTAALLNGNQPSTALQGAFYNAAISEGVFSATDSTSALVNKIFQQTFGFGANTYEQTAWSNLVTNGAVTKETLAWTIFKSYIGSTGSQFDAYKTSVQSKLVAMDAYNAELLADAASNLALAGGGTAAATARTYVSGVNSQATAATAIAGVAASVDALTVVPGTTYTLTTGGDSLTGTANNDTFNAVEIVSATGNTVLTWTTGDAITGGAGTDTLNITQTAAVTMPLGVTVSSVENVNVTSGAGVKINTVTGGGGFSGLTTLNTTSVAGLSTSDYAVTAAATTDVVATITGASGDNEGISLQGGRNVSLALSSTIGAAADAPAEYVVGTTTAAVGTVTVTSRLVGADTLVAGDIATKGGTTVSVTQSLGNAVNTTNTQGKVAVTGTATTTAVTVVQDAAATATATVVGKVNGTVTITDAGTAGATADTIATVTLANYGASTVTSSALSTLNLTGGTVASGALTLDAQGTVTPATTLALNLNGGSFGAITGTQAAAYTTLNVAGATAASTLADFTSAGVTALTVSGDKAVTFTTHTGLSALTSVTSTNTAGVTLGTAAIGTGVTFTGGAGADSIILGATTKAITLGGGNDTVTSAGLVGTGGSVNAGDGNDTIIMTTAESATAGASATFNSKFTGFEILRVSDAFTSTVDLDGVNQASTVILALTGATGGFLNNLASGGTVRYLANETDLVVNVRSAVATQTDVLNIDLSKTGAVLAAGQITAVNVETINITAADASTAALGSAANVNTMTLVATAATTINVSGNNGLTLTNGGNTAVTTFNASGVVANGNGTAGATDAATGLAVTFLSAKTSGSTTITGGAGDDVLTGNAAIDTITGGEGADVITGGAGNDIINLTETKAAADQVNFVAAGSSQGVDTITGFAAGTGADLVGIVDAVTTATTSSGAATFAASANKTLTAGASAFALGSDITNRDVAEIEATLSSFGNLGLSTAVSGTELLKALSSTDAAATSITASNNADKGYLVAYQNGNAYLYQYESGTGDNAITASEIALVGVFNGVAAGAFTAGDFVIA